MKKKSSWKRLQIRYRAKGKRRCRFCKTADGLIRKYGLYICRRCFKSVASTMGFKKY